MTHHLKNVVTALAFPLSVGIALLILALVAHLRRSRRWVAVGLGLALPTLLLPSLPVTSDRLRASLERRYLPSPVEELPEVDAIVVLGGFVAGPVPPRRFSDLSAASDRARHAARLFAAGRAPVILASGGGLAGSAPEADLIAELLGELGVPRGAILSETESRTTYENARFTRQLLEREGLKTTLLVTSALHMPRAMGTFRAAGVDAVAAPTDFEVEDLDATNLLRWLPDAAALEGSTRAIKEYAGMWVYRWRGWSR